MSLNPEKICLRIIVLAFFNMGGKASRLPHNAGRLYALVSQACCGRRDAYIRSFSRRVVGGGTPPLPGILFLFFQLFELAREGFQRQVYGFLESIGGLVGHQVVVTR